jgi:hypothetical protein
MIFNKIVTISLFLTIQLVGCAYKEYDPAHPKEYDDYWKNDDNRKNSVAYPFTKEAGDEWGSRKK